MDCMYCNRPPCGDVPLLTCGCYYCPMCYCKLKSSGVYLCFKHSKAIKRGTKKNKIETKPDGYKSSQSSSIIIEGNQGSPTTPPFL